MFVGDFAAKPVEKFCVAFSKATAHPTRGALVAARTRRNILHALFFLLSFFFCAYFAKRKSG